MLLVVPPRETPASASAVLYPGTIGEPAPSASEVLYEVLCEEVSSELKSSNAASFSCRASAGLQRWP